MKRCDWCGQDPLYVEYHDTEWGVPQRDSRALYEQLMLESFQSGLSWITILRKRDNFRESFANFVPETLAQWGESEVQRLLSDAGIVRHRGKIEATLRGARAWIALEERGGFSQFLWKYVDGEPLQPRYANLQDIPGQTPLSARIAKDLKAAGFGFCGPTVVYAFLQAAGLTNDHLVSCHRHAALSPAA